MKRVEILDFAPGEYQLRQMTLSTNALVSWAFPVRSVRLNITAGATSAGVTATVIQSAV
jgi:hypothetical protein